MDSISKIRQFFIRQPNAILGVLGFVLGILIAFEYAPNIPRIINPAVSNLALDEMEAKLNSEQASLKEQQEALDNEITSLQGNLKNRQSGLTEMVSNVDALKDRAGLTQKHGEGIEIVLDDTDKDDETANAIAHASDLRDLTDYFFSKGATGISIEAAGGVEERVIFQTSIDCIVNTVLINNTKAAPPFKMKILGNRGALIAAANDTVALKSIYDRIDKEGLVFYPTENANITLVKYSGNLYLDYAKVLQ